MAADDLEAFLVITGAMGSAPPIEGETLDADFKAQKAIEVESFEIGASVDLESNKTAQDQSVTKSYEESGQRESAFLTQLLQRSYQMFVDRDGSSSEQYTDAQILTISKSLDRSSPTLFQAYCSTSRTKEQGDKFRYASATLTVRRASVPRYILAVYEFKNVFIASYTLTSDDDARPGEEVEIGFQSFKVTYHPQNPTGASDPPVIVEFSFE